jgi:hypothetical protein
MQGSILALVSCALIAAGTVAAAEGTSQGAAPAPLAQGATPSGSVTLNGGTIAAGIGFEWADGTLNFHGKIYKFKLSGLSVLDIGSVAMNATGEVYDLARLEAFSGTYVSVTAGLTVGGGGSFAYLRNADGVVIKLVTTTVGLRFNLSADGVRIQLQHEPH